MQLDSIILLYEEDGKSALAEYFRLVQEHWGLVELRGYNPQIDDYTAECVDLNLGTGVSVKDMILWCCENTTDEWAYDTLVCEERFMFTGTDDALQFKLIWVGYDFG